MLFCEYIVTFWKIWNLYLHQILKLVFKCMMKSMSVFVNVFQAKVQIHTWLVYSQAVMLQIMKIY
jgi:hypothetical protein